MIVRVFHCGSRMSDIGIDPLNSSPTRSSRLKKSFRTRDFLDAGYNIFTFTIRGYNKDKAYNQPRFYRTISLPKKERKKGTESKMIKAKL